MIELHERLSEFSYGYGVTREVEQLLAGVGLDTVPFLPSLLQEKKIGFDVSFKKKGVPLLLQFKLGQSLTVITAGVLNVGNVHPDPLAEQALAFKTFGGSYVYGEESPFGVNGREYFVRLQFQH